MLLMTVFSRLNESLTSLFFASVLASKPLPSTTEMSTFFAIKYLTTSY